MVQESQLVVMYCTVRILAHTWTSQHFSSSFRGDDFRKKCKKYVTGNSLCESDSFFSPVFSYMFCVVDVLPCVIVN